MSELADELAARLVIRSAREDADSAHLRGCEGLTVSMPRAYDGTYGCDTGCEYVRLEARLTCPHGEVEDFQYGEFGDLEYLIKEMQRDAEGQ